jgi:tight adherence protein B
VTDPAGIALAVFACGSAVAGARAARSPVASFVRVDGSESPRSWRADARAWTVALAIGGAAMGTVALGWPGAVFGLAAGPAWSWFARRRRRRRRADRLEEDLADAVTAIAAAMRASMSLPQAVAYAAQEVEDPLGETLRRAIGRTELGEPFDVALARWGEEVGGDDARLIVGVLSLHRRTGGDLPHVLDRVAATLRERRAATREVRALTAQARLSGGILGALPVGFFLFLLVTSRSDVAAAFGSTAGRAALGLGFTMELAAFFWIRKLLRVA